MAKGDLVDAGEDVVRLIRHIDFKNGIVGASAFDRPEKDHDGLSVSRRRMFDQDDALDLKRIREVLGAWRELKASHRLAQISVADILAAGKEAQRSLSVVEDPIDPAPPKPGNPAHALILGLPFAGSEQGTLEAMTASDLLARKINPKGVFSAVDPAV